MKKEQRPGVWLGHVYRKVADVKSSTQFFKNLGMHVFMEKRSMAILELRGGTHLLLFKNTPQNNWVREQEFDLMVDDVKKVHARLKKERLTVSALKKDLYHLTFQVTDPEGKNVVIYSSHTGGRLV